MPDCRTVRYRNKGTPVRFPLFLLYPYMYSVVPKPGFLFETKVIFFCSSRDSKIHNKYTENTIKLFFIQS